MAIRTGTMEGKNGGSQKNEKSSSLALCKEVVTW
jgi:hypothetical protein